jgi:HAD superfamily hydrolase (TIGR01509 family)
MGYIFDLDQTIVDSSIAEEYRKQRNWTTVYSMVPRFRVYEGINEVLGILRKKGEKVCVVTSSPEKYCRAVLKEFGIQAYATVCYHDTKHHKPSPEPILRAVEILRENPEDVVSIGDAENDIIASRKAGVISCLALWGRQSDRMEVGADYIFRTVHDLREYVSK